ncbi:SDR family NAD(P)-dependent oxidoreductase, partial [Vibrio alginolyticus]
MANTLIVGAGWLGTPLAETLMKDGHYVVVTRRSQTRLKELPTSLTHSVLFDFNQLNATARLDELLKQHQITHV